MKQIDGIKGFIVGKVVTFDPLYSIPFNLQVEGNLNSAVVS